MPYNNAYNQTIAAQLQNLYANHIAHENTANDNTRQNDVMDPLEGMALRHDEVKGGNGTAAATLQDLGYEPMNGATGSGEPQEPKPKRKYARKTMKVAVPVAMDSEPTATAGGADGGGVSAGGVSGGGVSAGGVSGGDDEAAREVGGGVSAGAKKKRARKAKGGGILDTVRDIADTVGSVGKAVAPFAPLLLAAGEPKEAEKNDEPMEEGGAKKGRTRHDIVRQVMKEKGMKLIEATKYVKEHGLYKKGGAFLSLASLDAMKGNQDPQMWETGGVPNSKLPEESKYTAAGKKPRKPRAKKQATA